MCSTGCREKRFNPKNSHKSHIFHPGPYIPETERFYSNSALLPGPGRYNPQLTACPCKRGTEYIEESLRASEQEKWKFSPLYVKVPHLKPCTCDPPNIRKIHGKGFSSVFKSNTKRLLDKPSTDSHKKEAKKNLEKFPMIFDSQYIRAITQPKRELLSYRIVKKPVEETEIKFNTTATTMPRQKIRTNKAVAFMSSCPRFEGGGGKATFLANKNTSKKSTSNISLKKVSTTPRVASGQRDLESLIRLPQRYRNVGIEGSGNDKLGNLFPHLPKPKILLKQVKFNVTCSLRD